MPRIKYHIIPDKMEEDNDLGGEITVVDVYDIASDIGKECEKIIDQYGADAVTSLMPKVISALELLENLATRNERENTQLNDLRSKISQLENDKLEKAEYRQKFEKELEVIEEQWRAETKELLAVVSRLQEENRRLAKDASPSHQPLSPTLQHGNGDVLQKLKDSVEKQRDEIRIKDKLLQDKCCDIDNLKSQVERLNSTSRELRRKHKLFQSQVRTLCEERADFLVQLQDQQRDIMGLRQRLGLAQKENEDLTKCDPPIPSNKAVYDLDDPNRPRFTTQELKDILHERNELKARVSDLEDELETYRPKNKSETIAKLFPFMEKIENACDNILSSKQ
jgi:chromosome segregation ATPase